MTKQPHQPLEPCEGRDPCGACQLIRDALTAAAVQRFAAWKAVEQRCESPIESLLLAALFAAGQIEPQLRFFAVEEGPTNYGLVGIYQQAPLLGRYRVDVFIDDRSSDPHQHLVVECDGHDYHERTKEQAQADKARDRALVRAGFKVIRFTGSELFKDPKACATEVLQHLGFIQRRHQRQLAKATP